MRRAERPVHAEVERLRTTLRAHPPGGARERWSLARTLALLDWLPEPFDQERDPAHVTGSAIVLDDRSRVLLHRHKRLGIWLQPGGHLEPGEAPADAAVRETLEETGVVVHHPTGGARLLHVDVHPGPRGHLHLDLRYLLYADGAAAFAPAAGESTEVAWTPADEACERSDASLAAAVATARTIIARPDRPR